MHLTPIAATALVAMSALGCVCVAHASEEASAAEATAMVKKGIDFIKDK